MVEYNRNNPRPPFDDLKRSERRIYLRCLIAMITGALMLAGVWTTQSVIATIVGTFGIIIIISALAVFGFHFDTFYKAKRKLEAKENNEVYKESYVKWPAWYTRWGRTALILLAATGVCVRKDA